MESTEEMKSLRLRILLVQYLGGKPTDKPLKQGPVNHEKVTPSGFLEDEGSSRNTSLRRNLMKVQEGNISQ